MVCWVCIYPALVGPQALIHGWTPSPLRHCGWDHFYSFTTKYIKHQPYARHLTGLWRFECEKDEVGSFCHWAYSPVRIMILSSVITRAPKDQRTEYFLLVGLSPGMQSIQPFPNVHKHLMTPDFFLLSPSCYWVPILPLIWDTFYLMAIGHRGKIFNVHSPHTLSR